MNQNARETVVSLTEILPKSVFPMYFVITRLYSSVAFLLEINRPNSLSEIPFFKKY